MKKYSFILAVVGLALLACNKEKVSDEEILASRSVTKLQVGYSLDGASVSAVRVSSKPAVKTIQVAVNDDNLKWNVESDRAWCVVRPEEHKGPGSITVEIDSNEDFSARDNDNAATLTFVAGNYRGSQITVSQSAAAFIVSQPYMVAGKSGGSMDLLISVPEGAGFTPKCPEDITMTKTGESTSDGLRSENWNLSIAANEGDTRYLTVDLENEDGEHDQIAVAQFGTDVPLDGENKIFFDNETPAVLSFLAPEFIIKALVEKNSGEFPEYVTSEITPNGDGTVTVKISLSENLSDCNEIREAQLAIKLANVSASIINLPVIRQDYLPAHGIVTAKGFQLFAAAVAAGNPTLDWEKDGVATLLEDIDMSGVEGWTGIGTVAHPFSGKFNGNSHAIKNLKKAKAGIFHICDRAEITGLTLGSGSTIYVDGSYDAPLSLGGIVDIASATSISSCTSEANLTFAGIASDEQNAMVGGIVGLADSESTIKGCKTSGGMSFTSAIDENAILYAGGIAGRSLGQVTRCEFNGTMSHTSSIRNICLGGVMGVLESGVNVSNNSFLGTIKLEGNASKARVGGLYGFIPSGERAFDNASDKSLASGSIIVNKFNSASSTRVFVGGMVGLLGEDASLKVKDFTVQTKITLNLLSTISAEHLCAGVLLGGCEIAEPATDINLDHVTNQGTVYVNLNSSVELQIRHVCVGGLVGLANGPATFDNCINKAELGTVNPDELGDFKVAEAIYSKKSNGYTMIMGGIAGLCFGGNMSFESCSNQSVLTNNFYTNRQSGSAWGVWETAAATGSILGAFNFRTTPQDISVKINKCTAKNNLIAYRGFLGGIAGYVYNAEITDCTWEGSSMFASDKKDNQASYKGGIAGGFGKGSVSSCKAKGNLYPVFAGSAESADGGGILAHIKGTDDVTVTSCSYFGNMEVHYTSGTPYYFTGGIVGLGSEKTTVTKCKFGGSFQGVPASEDNVSSMVFGNGKGNASEITYWNGN